MFFGIKKKFKGIVYKRRLALTLPAALAFVSGLPYEQACARWPLPDAGLAAVALAPATRQIARELEAAMNRWLPLAPSMGIACDRVAWAYRPEVREARGCDELLDAELQHHLRRLLWRISTVIASVRHGGPSSSRASPSWR